MRTEEAAPEEKLAGDVKSPEEKLEADRKKLAMATKQSQPEEKATERSQLLKRSPAPKKSLLHRGKAGCRGKACC